MASAPTFDPDAYIQSHGIQVGDTAPQPEAQAPAFDPDAYMKSHGIAVSQPVGTIPDDKKTLGLATAGQFFGNAANEVLGAPVKISQLTAKGLRAIGLPWEGLENSINSTQKYRNEYIPALQQATAINDGGFMSDATQAVAGGVGTITGMVPSFLATAPVGAAGKVGGAALQASRLGRFAPTATKLAAKVLPSALQFGAVQAANAPLGEELPAAGRGLAEGAAFGGLGMVPSRVARAGALAAYGGGEAAMHGGTPGQIVGSAIPMAAMEVLHAKEKPEIQLPARPGAETWNGEQLWPNRTPLPESQPSRPALLGSVPRPEPIPFSFKFDDPAALRLLDSLPDQPSREGMIPEADFHGWGNDFRIARETPPLTDAYLRLLDQLPVDPTEALAQRQAQVEGQFAEPRKPTPPPPAPRRRPLSRLAPIVPEPLPKTEKAYEPPRPSEAGKPMTEAELEAVIRMAPKLGEEAPITTAQAEEKLFGKKKKQPPILEQPQEATDASAVREDQGILPQRGQVEEGGGTNRSGNLQQEPQAGIEAGGQQGGAEARPRDLTKEITDEGNVHVNPQGEGRLYPGGQGRGERGQVSESPQEARGVGEPGEGKAGTSQAVEPWQMTRDEFASQAAEARAKTPKGKKASQEAVDLAYNRAEDQHMDAVEQAVTEGKFVPRSVLEDYAGETWADKAINHLNKLSADAEKSIGDGLVKGETGSVYIGAVGDVAKKAVQKVTQAVPDPVKKQFKKQFSREFTQNPAVRDVYDSYLDAKNRGENVAKRLQDLVVQHTATPEERLAVNRVLAQAPQAMINMSSALRENIKGTQQEVRAEAQRQARLMQSIGIEPHKEWMDGPSHYYPNLYNQHLVKEINGKLFWFGSEKTKVGLSAADNKKLSSARTMDYWRVVNRKTGKVVDFFDNEADANAFAQKSGSGEGRFGVKYYATDSTGKRRLAVEWFKTAKEQRDFVNDPNNAEAQTIRVTGMPKGEDLVVAAPLDYAEKVKIGLSEDVFRNLKEFAKNNERIEKVHALDNFAKVLQNYPDLWVSARETPPEGFVKVSDLKIRVPSAIEAKGLPAEKSTNPALRQFLDGYVERSLAEDLAGLYADGHGALNQLGRLISTMDRPFRAAVTYLNPFRYGKQIGENNLSLAMAHSRAFSDIPLRTEGNKEFWKWFAGKSGPAEGTLRKFVESGASGHTIIQSPELSSISHLLADNIDAVKHAEGIRAWLGETKAGRAIEQAKALYSAQDDVYKYQLFKYLVEKEGKSVNDAAQFVKDTMFDFNNAPRIVKSLSRYIPFAPSVLYQFARTQANLFGMKPGRMALKWALAVGGMAALRAAADKAAGVTPEERKRQNYGMMEFPLPFTDSRGRKVTLNASWLLPYSNLISIPHSWKSANASMRSALPMFAQGPATVFQQKDRWGNTLVYHNYPPDQQLTYNQKKQVERENNDLWLAAISDEFPGMFGQYWVSMYKNSQKDPSKRQPFLMQNVTGPALGMRSKINYQQSVAPGGLSLPKLPELPSLPSGPSAP